MRRKEFRHVIIEKGKTRGAKLLGIGGEVEFSCHDRRFQLGGAIAAIAKALQSVVQIGKGGGKRGREPFLRKFKELGGFSRNPQHDLGALSMSPRP